MSSTVAEPPVTEGWEEDVEVALLHHQWRAFTEEKPFVCLLTGLGGGKTWAGARWLITRAVDFPTSIHLATANTYGQCRDVVIPELHEALEEWGIPFRPVPEKPTDKPTNLYLDLGDVTAVIHIRSLERAEVLRGTKYGSWWGDEIRDAKETAITTAFGRLRCKQVDQVRYLWTTTPKGFQSVVYKWHVIKPQEMAASGTDCPFALIRATTDDNPHLPESYTTNLEAAYDTVLLKQERAGDFVNLVGLPAYRSYTTAGNVSRPIYNPSLPLCLAWDFNVNPLAVLVGQAMPTATGTVVNVLRELNIQDAWVVDACREILTEYGPKGKTFRHDGRVVVYGDPAGRARAVQASKTAYQVIEKTLREGFEGVPGYSSVTMDVASKDPTPRDRIDATCSMLEAADGTRRVQVHVSCVELQRDLEENHWKDDGTLDKDDKTRTHWGDALSYWIHRAHRPDPFRSEPGHGMRRSGRRRSGRERYGDA